LKNFGCSRNLLLLKNDPIKMLIRISRQVTLGLIDKQFLSRSAHTNYLISLLKSALNFCPAKTNNYDSEILFRQHPTHNSLFWDDASTCCLLRWVKLIVRFLIEEGGIIR